MPTEAHHCRQAVEGRTDNDGAEFRRRAALAAISRRTARDQGPSAGGDPNGPTLRRPQPKAALVPIRRRTARDQGPSGRDLPLRPNRRSPRDTLSRSPRTPEHLQTLNIREHFLALRVIFFDSDKYGVLPCLAQDVRYTRDDKAALRLRVASTDAA